MAIIHRTIYNSRLRTPFSITAKCGEKKIDFKYEDCHNLGKWMMTAWKEQEDEFFYTHPPVYVYYNIDWDADNILYAKYELEGSCEDKSFRWMDKYL